MQCHAIRGTTIATNCTSCRQMSTESILSQSDYHVKGARNKDGSRIAVKKHKHPSI